MLTDEQWEKIYAKRKAQGLHPWKLDRSQLDELARVLNDEPAYRKSGSSRSESKVLPTLVALDT